MKSQYTDKVSQLEIACSSKYVSIKLLEEELATMKLLMLEKDARIATLSDLQLLMELNQTSAIQLGLHQACVDMKEKYTEELKGKNVLYSYPDAQCQIMERFAEMTTYKYSLVSALESEEMDVDGLKKLLKIVDSSGTDEVGSE
ncbi:unnamed protein product [Lactuca virosa]|uniref:Uncharacterized protein n=1 Tax=Lactuca virosa TaxID=75947 RepID=A0AAU9M4D0_9ASTR|nr:unnamed protein product [Lactuca virosa]